MTDLNAPGNGGGPIAIGGVGGSGTRVLAGALAAAGVHMGSDINESLDTLWFTLLFKDRRILACDEAEFDRRLALFLAAMGQGSVIPALPPDLVYGDRPGTGMVQQDEAWLNERLEKLTCAIADRQTARVGVRRWGWKEPNTHIVLDRLSEALPELRYVHLVRNGLDMAWSRNQNQLRFWGYHFLHTGRDPEITPRNSLAYWCRAEKRACDIGRAMGERFLSLRFEDLCAEPQAQVMRLLEFCALPFDRSLVDGIAASVRLPESVGRYRQHPLDDFAPEDIEYVRARGYPI